MTKKRSKRATIATLTNVQQFDAPLLVYAEPRNVSHWKEESPMVVHISDKGGEWEEKAYTATCCNRVISYSCLYVKAEIPATDNADFKLCTRCGSRTDFVQALVEFHEHHRLLDQARERRERLRRQVREQARAVRCVQLITLLNKLRMAGFDVQADYECERLWLTTQGGTAFHVVLVEEGVKK